MTGPVRARVTVPGSKSATNRALVLAALAEGPSTLYRPLRSRDSLLMAGALRALGAGIEDGPEGSWLVTPAERLTGGDTQVDMGAAGTVMRFMPPVAALAEGPVRFDGDKRSHERPVGPLVHALRALGAEIDDAGRPGRRPLTVRGGDGVPAAERCRSTRPRRSQFVSALLLSGARFEHGVDVRHVGGRLPSQPYIEMAVQMVRAAGVDVDDSEPERWRVAPGPIKPVTQTIEPDLSNAAPFLAAALVTGGTVTVADWPRVTTQPGDRLREILTLLGGTCTFTDEGLECRGTGTIHGVDLDLADEAELTPTIAALAALADGPSRLRGIGHIRLHETDRLAAIAKEINDLGGKVTELPEELLIEPAPLHGGVFRSYEDHRMATTGAVLGLAVPGIQVQDIATTAKTLPDFPGRWAALLAGTDYATDHAA